VAGAWAASQVWRRAGEVDAESGAAAMARRLTRPTLDGPGHPVEVDLAADSAAVGRTLAELDLRARSGATVVAVTRAGRPPELPRPDDPLQAGDVLALVGARASVEAARVMLGPHPEPL
ncbi:MAG: TrkA C-terminal domain-containing protein, partial [Myxococcota bacterium]